MTRDELQRLIDVIVQELSAVAPQDRDSLCLSLGGRASAVQTDCVGVIDAGASRVGVHAVGGAPSTVASMIDHTLLKPDATRKDIEDLCREAAQFSFATVCVNPDLGGVAAAALAASPVGVCSVIGFPLGATTADVKGLRNQTRDF